VFGEQIYLERKASARNLFGEEIRLESGCRVFGEIKYTRIFNAEEDVYLAETPEKVEKLPSEES